LAPSTSPSLLTNPSPLQTSTTTTDWNTLATQQSTQPTFINPWA
jgi:hypothetical protein